MTNDPSQAGMTLLETLIALGVGSIVIASVATVYVSTVTSTSAMLRASKLNQEVAAVATVMANDVRRAGYWGNMAIADYQNPQNNPFARANETALEVHAGNVDQGPTGSGGCIVYAYDANDDGVVDNDDIRGFRLVAGVVEMRERGDTAANAVHDVCNDSDDVWRPVTDGNLISITALSFDLGGSTCLNTDEPNGVDDGGTAGVVDDDLERDCYATVPPVGSGVITVETREVGVTVTGSLASDPSVEVKIAQDVRVRNDLIRAR